MAAGPTAYTPLQLCAIRVARLDATGVPNPGAHNLYTECSPIDLSLTPIISAAESFEQKSGCGDICATFEGYDRTKGFTLAMTLCHLDAELIEMLTGGTVLTRSGSDVGYMAPAANAAAPTGVCVEAWSKMWDAEQQAVVSGKPGYFQFAFPKTTWAIGNLQLKDGIVTVPLTGKGVANSNFYNGPGNDWPTAITSSFAWQQVGGLPTCTNGYGTLTGS